MRKPGGRQRAATRIRPYGIAHGPDESSIYTRKITVAPAVASAAQ